MKVVGSGTSPFARKVRVALMEQSVEHEFVPASAWTSARAASHLNPLAKLPVLVRPDGSVLFDSRVIVEYVDSLGTPGRLLPSDLEPRLRVRRLEALADGVSEAVTLRVQETWRPEAARSARWLERQRVKVDDGIAALAAELRGQAWLHGDRLGLADIAAGCALGVVDFWFPDDGWHARFPALAAYWRGLCDRPSFAATVPVLPAGATFPAL